MSELPPEVRLFQPLLGDEELAAVKAAFDRSWVGLGGQVSAFEREFEESFDAGAALGVNSGTAALQLAVEAFGFPEGKKVLVNDLTFVASATCILINRLMPVLVDCDPVTLGMDLEDAARKVDADTVAMVVVHYGGHPAPMDRVMEFARKHNLKVIEDCAHCIGGDYQGRKLGTWGDVGCFSFEEKKGMTTGDGGMMVSADRDLIDRMRPHRWVGIDKDTWRRRDSYTDAGDLDTKHWHYEVAVLGYKYNMNDLAACIGRVQLRKLAAMNETKRRAIQRYLGHLRECPDMTPLLPYEADRGAYWLFGVRVADRDHLIRHLKQQRISTGVHYMPLHAHPLFSRYQSPLPNSASIWPTLLTLPLHARLTDAEVDRVGEALQQVTGTRTPVPTSARESARPAGLRA
jgi:perosamine synthetase